MGQLRLGIAHHDGRHGGVRLAAPITRATVPEVATPITHTHAEAELDKVHVLPLFILTRAGPHGLVVHWLTSVLVYKLFLRALEELRTKKMSKRLNRTPVGE